MTDAAAMKVLKNDILTNLSKLKTVRFSAKRESKAYLYEVYTWAMILETLASSKLLKAPYVICTANGSQTNNGFFRGGPGSLPKDSEHTHARFRIASQKGPVDWELHTSLYVSGRSRVKHECDVALITRGEADRCRKSTETLNPNQRWLGLYAECKCYRTTNIELGLVRGFLGGAVDLRAPRAFLVTTRKLTSDKQQSYAGLLGKYGRRLASRVFPSPQNQSSVDSFCDDIRAALVELTTKKKW